MATPRPSTQDTYGTRRSTFLAARRFADAATAAERPAAVWVSATVLDLIRRLDAAKVPAVWDTASVRESCAFLIHGRLLTGEGHPNRRALAEALDPENVHEVMARRAAVARIDVPAVRRVGYPFCTVCGQPVDPAGFIGWATTTHPLCDPGEE
jgi:hypothetical protein